MKIPLIDQIAEAELHRDELRQAGHTDRLDRAETIVLSLRFLQTYEQGFRETFMRQRQPTNQQGA